ncbi:Transposon Tf2-6 poly [Labeo rohita]|uniref:ribonuclease H n=1 Tax=Labeo rohita TaxID=84645 RepID=A0A498M0Y4_LABRO|nr:Transposon Tf2-6 poly [Labeo rohita]
MVIEGLPGVVCHMDDVLIWGESQAQHDQRLHTVLARNEKAGITLNLEKCELGRQEVKFLGHIIAECGVRPDPDKTRAVLQMKEPDTVSEVRSFLGMVTSYLNGKAYTAASQAYQADLLKDLDKGQGLFPDEVPDVRHTIDLTLRATKQAA